MNEREMENDHYIPGVCNIGIVEVRARARKGWLALVITGITWGALAYYHISSGWQWVVAIPAATSALYFLESYFRFCARFAMRGLFNFSKEDFKSLYQFTPFTSLQSLHFVRFRKSIFHYPCLGILSM